MVFGHEFLSMVYTLSMRPVDLLKLETAYIRIHWNSKDGEYNRIVDGGTNKIRYSRSITIICLLPNLDNTKNN